MLWSRCSVHTAPLVVLASRRPRFVSATRDTTTVMSAPCVQHGPYVPPQIFPSVESPTLECARWADGGIGGGGKD